MEALAVALGILTALTWLAGLYFRLRCWLYVGGTGEVKRPQSTVDILYR
jgi:hypothetical protein